MNTPRTIALILVALSISACDPAFKTTEDICAANQDEAVRLTVENYVVTTNEDGNEYKLYLEDILNALKLADGQILNPDDEIAISSILNKVNDPTYMNYTLIDGEVTEANNPLDFMENLIATTDKDKEIDAFVQAKKHVADGIAADDGYCNYVNRNITVTSLVDSVSLYAELFMSYSPFTNVTQTSVSITKSAKDLSSIQRRAEAPYFGFVQTTPEDFKARGYTQPLIRQSTMNNPDLTETLIIDDDFGYNLGQIEFSTANTFCDRDNTSSDTSDFAVCADDIVTRAVAKPERCAAPVDDEGNLLTDDDGNELTDENGRKLANEVNKVQVRSIDLNGAVPALSGVQRFRVEADYPNSEVRIYVSKYIEATKDINGDTIENPTRCEKQAILDELADLNPNEGVLLTAVPDPNYDYYTETVIEQDEDGNDVEVEIEIIPTPAITFTGITIPSRQSRVE